jgi:hypothetical protein
MQTKGETMKSYLIYKHLEPVVAQLTDEQAGELFKAIFEYERTQNAPEMSQQAALVFTIFKIHLDKGREDYNRKCEINRANAKRPRATASDRKRVGANINKNKNININWKDV